MSDDTPMSYDEAFQALTEAAAAEEAAERGEQAPVAPAAVATPEGANTPEPVQATPEPIPAPAENTEPEAFNPDTLPPELIPAWKQLQAAWTPRLQEAAEVRKQLDALGGLDTVQEAVDLYNRISDTSNWPQLHQELSEAMQEMGLTKAEADQLAEQGLKNPPVPDSLAGLDLDDPDLAPIAKALQAQQAQQARLEHQLQALQSNLAFRAQAEEAAQAEAQRNALMHRQLAAIQQSNPHYGDDDLGMVLTVGSFYNDDLVEAQRALETYVASRMDRYFSKKQAAATPSIQSQPGAGASSITDNSPQDLDQAEREAIEYLRGLQAAGELDFT